MGGGGGTVTGGGLNCTIGVPDGCTAEVPNPGNSTTYNTVTLTAVPDGASVFKGWIGCTAVTGDPRSCTLAVNGVEAVVARFEPSTYPLTAVIVGAGTVSGGGITCSSGSPDGCSTPAANGAIVELVATPAPGYVFKSWAGCNSTTGTTCRVTMTMAKTVTATFQLTYPLQISFQGAGSGAVRAGTVTCASSSGPCTIPEPSGATVFLTATADAGSTFAGWAGACAGTGTTCSVPMTMARDVTATFASP
jgi:uncharacterized repeat protein (TIGR02543 family)